MSNCIFCKIIEGKVKSDIVYQDKKIMAFVDISPQAPTHILIIPKEHYESLEEAAQKDPAVLGHIMEVVPKIAKQKQLEMGYRVVFNCGEDATQLVPHIHFHLLGGRRFHWPPG